MKFMGAAGALFAAAVFAVGSDSFVGMDGSAHHPFASAARARIFLFARTDCPITNRYAPELQRISKEFAGRGVDFWLVYPDPAATPQGIRDHVAQYSFPGTVLRDPHHQLVKLARATIAPEAAIFDQAGHLVYHGRIDDRWLNPGRARPAAQTHDLEDAISAVLAGRPPARAETHAVGCWLADVQ
jgi:hypothetical protein